jgi:hypothetical protein
MKPKYFSEKKAEDIYPVNYLQVLQEANDYRNKKAINPSNEDKEKVGLFLIDVQNDFTNPNGTLFVPNSPQDNINTSNFIYENVEKITSIYLSLDTHFIYQIFHAAWWMDENGNPPPPFTLISYDDVAKGKWNAKRDPRGSIAYCRNLKQ